jgi:ABC-type branched-subunit amino acid transport system ATPase component
VLRDDSLPAPDSDVVGVLGGNGAGKTTLLKTLSGLVNPRGGEVALRAKVGRCSYTRNISSSSVWSSCRKAALFGRYAVDYNLQDRQAVAALQNGPRDCPRPRRRPQHRRRWRRQRLSSLSRLARGSR